MDAVLGAVDQVAGPAPRRFQRVLPVLCACATAGAAATVAAFDPAAPGSRFPACQFHALTGLWCPGCGLTRGFHLLFRGDVAGALGMNLFVPVVLVAVALGFWNWFRTSWQRAPLQLPAVLRRGWVTVMPATLVVYGVLRNIPAAPFRALAP